MAGDPGSYRLSVHLWSGEKAVESFASKPLPQTWHHNMQDLDTHGTEVHMPHPQGVAELAYGGKHVLRSSFQLKRSKIR